MIGANPLEVCPFCYFEFRRADCVAVSINTAKPIYVCAGCVKENGLTALARRQTKEQRKQPFSFTVPQYLVESVDRIAGPSRSSAVILALTAFQTNNVSRLSEAQLNEQFALYPRDKQKRSLITVSLNSDQAAALQTIGDGNRSLGLERVLAALLAASEPIPDFLLD